MTEQDFANMPIEELKAYCRELQEELNKAQRFLRERTPAQLIGAK